MPRIYTGGCACGAVRYTIAAEPLAMNDCQCRQCQHDSGTGHGSYLTFPAAAVQTEGEPGRWRATGDQGMVKERAFCRNCGSPVYMIFPDLPDYFVVTAGSLDAPALYQPQFVVWTAAGQVWDHYPADTVRFAHMPPR